MKLDRRRLAGTILRLRHEAGWTQCELAGRARIPRSTFAHVERGRWLPDLCTAVAVADALCITVDALIEDAR